MFKTISKIWLSLAGLFDPVQDFFNGNFWDVVLVRFGKYLKNSVLDLACGTGELIDHIAPKKYLGIDINPNYIRYAKSKRSCKNVSFLVSDITRASVAGFETAVFISAAHHLSAAQLSSLTQSLKVSRVNRFILIDDYPVGPLAGFLAFLDDRLGGGKYFRNQRQIIALVKPYLTILETGEFTTSSPFYHYPYLIASAKPGS